MHTAHISLRLHKHVQIELLWRFDINVPHIETSLVTASEDRHYCDARFSMIYMYSNHVGRFDCTTQNLIKIFKNRSYAGEKKSEMSTDKEK